jgi:hypothetical protein
MSQARWNRIVLAALVAAAFGTAVATLSAQAGTGSLEGMVRDSAGVRIATARVVVVGTARSMATDSSGRYSLAGIPAGYYRVQARYVGTRPIQVDSIRILPGQITHLDIVLAPSRVTVMHDLGLSGSSGFRASSDAGRPSHQISCPFGLTQDAQADEAD